MFKKCFFFFLIVSCFFSCKQAGWVEPADNFENVADADIQFAADTYFYGGFQYLKDSENNSMSCVLMYPDKNLTDGKSPAEYSSDFKLPVFVYVHSGSWMEGNFEGKIDGDGGVKQFVQTPNYELEFGKYVVVFVDYRLYDEEASDSLSFDDMLSDITSCLRFIRKNADALHLDVSRVVIGGDSAGGHLSLLYAYMDKSKKSDLRSPVKISGVYSGCGPADLSSDSYADLYSLAVTFMPDMVGYVMEVMGATFSLSGCNVSLENVSSSKTLKELQQANVERLEKYSPVKWASGKIPTLLIYGKSDFLVPTSTYNALVEKIGAKNSNLINCTFDGGHCDYGFMQNYGKTLNDFIKKCLGV